MLQEVSVNGGRRGGFVGGGGVRRGAVVERGVSMVHGYCDLGCRV